MKINASYRYHTKANKFSSSVPTEFAFNFKYIIWERDIFGLVYKRVRVKMQCPL